MIGRPPRLWMVDQYGHGGIGRYAVDVANILESAADTTVATSAIGPVDGLRGRSVVWFSRASERRSSKVLGGGAGLLRSVRQVRRGDVAWIALGIRPSFELALALLLRARGARVVATIHNRGPHQRGDSPTVLRAASLAHTVVVHTTAVLEWAQEHGLRAVRLPFPPPVVKTPTQLSPTRADLGIAPERIVVSLLGYLHAYKGIEVLGRAMAQVEQDGPVHLLLAGRLPDGAQGQGVRHSLEGLAARSDVTVRAGWLEEPELACLLELTDVAVLPYLEIDNSGAGALALSRALPAVASDLPGLRELFGNAALYVEPGDAEALAEVLRTVPQALEDLRGRAAAHVAVDLPQAYGALARLLGLSPVT